MTTAHLNAEELHQALLGLTARCHIFARWRHRTGHAPQLWRGRCLQVHHDHAVIDWHDGPRSTRDRQGTFPRDDIQYVKVGIRQRDEDTMLVYLPGQEAFVQMPTASEAATTPPSEVDVDERADDEEEEDEEEYEDEDYDQADDQQVATAPGVRLTAAEIELVRTCKDVERLTSRVKTLEIHVAKQEATIKALEERLATLEAVPAAKPVKAERPRRVPARAPAVEEARARLRQGIIGSGDQVASPQRRRQRSALTVLDPSTWPVEYGPELRFVIDELKDRFVNKQSSDLRPQALKALDNLKKQIDERAECLRMTGKDFEGVADFWLSRINTALFNLRIEVEGRKAGADVGWMKRQFNAAEDIEDDAFTALLAQAPAAPKTREAKPSPKKPGAKKAAKPSASKEGKMANEVFVDEQ